MAADGSAGTPARGAERGPVPSGGLPTICVDGLVFRDLDHDGRLAPYEDWRLPADERVADLLSRMTLAEKVGCMLHASAPAHGELGSIGVGTSYDLDGVRDLVHTRGINTLITRLSLPATGLAEQNNALQRVAAGTRLGIPMTLSSDPRHHFTEVLGLSSASIDFTQWPEPLGLAAIGDLDLARRVGDNIRAEYRAVGLHMSLAPQADLATSQRWPRIAGTFGENPRLVRQLVGALVEGIQAGRDGLGPDSVAAVVKHWVGYGASKDGFDGHNWYGRFSAFPTGAFSDHVEAFQDALTFNVAGVMPTYNILEGASVEGAPLEPVGGGFSQRLVDGLLRQGLGFRGVVISDWSITRDPTEATRTGVPAQAPNDIAMPWGVEDLDRVHRFAMAVNAGVDQVGGEDDPIPLLRAVEEGLIAPERIDEAVQRLLRDKFRLGLFDNPLVDPGLAGTLVGGEQWRREAATAQRNALTWIKRSKRASELLREGPALLRGLAVQTSSAGVVPAADSEEAVVAVVRTATPYQDLHPGYFFGRLHHEGDLDFKADDPATRELLDLCETLPTILVVHMDRPAVLGDLVDAAEGVLVDFGASDDAVLDVLMSGNGGHGRLPFRLHWSMEDVLLQPCDRPSDSLPGRFPLGFSDALELALAHAALDGLEEV